MSNLRKNILKGKYSAAKDTEAHLRWSIVGC